MCNEAIKEVMTEYMVDAFSRVKSRHFKAWVMNVIKKKNNYGLAANFLVIFVSSSWYFP